MGIQTSTGRARGITLIELMIALLLCLLLIAGIIQIFLGNRQAYQFTEGLSRVQENGRMAMELLNTRVRMAGYFGCATKGYPHNKLAVPPGDFAYGFARAIEGFESLGSGPGATLNLVPVSADTGHSGDWLPPLPTQPSALPGRALTGSDVIVVRNASTESHPLAPENNNPGRVDVTEHAQGQYQSGEILIVSDCQKATIFRATEVAAGSDTTSPISIFHGTTGGHSPGNSNAERDQQQSFGSGAELKRIEQWIFFIARGTDELQPGLWQARLDRDGRYRAEELVEGVETMQITYGLDPDGNGAVTAGYVTADNVSDWNDVVSVRIGLLLASPNEIGSMADSQEYLINGTRVVAPGDRRLRQVFTTTVALRNRLP